MSKRLPYGLARRIENFCQGQGLDGDEFWLQVLDVPEIDKKHMVKLPVLLGYMTESGIEVIGEFNVHCYPSVLDELDREMQLDTWYPGMQWYQVCYEVKAWETKDGRLMHSRKMKIYSVRDIHLPTPPKPAAVSSGVLGASTRTSNDGSERGQDGMQTGPPKPAAGERAASAVVDDHAPARIAPDSERGQAGAGGAPESAGTGLVGVRPVGLAPSVPDQGQQRDTPPPAEPCPHEGTISMLKRDASGLFNFTEPGFYCNDCGERVG